MENKEPVIKMHRVNSKQSVWCSACTRGERSIHIVRAVIDYAKQFVLRAFPRDPGLNDI